MTATLTCKECGHANEAQRIYCHNCGVKLDRSILPPEQTFEETQEDVRKRVTKLVTPKSGFWVGSWKSALCTVGWALFTACVIQICRTPDDILPMPHKGEMTEKPLIPMAINHAMLESTSQEVRIQEQTANDYLRESLKPKSTGLIDNELKFLRLMVQFKKGVCQFTSEQSVFDHPLYARVSYRLQMVDNKVRTVCVAGSLGRLPIHPVLMNYADFAFQPLWDSLDHERKQIDQMQGIDIHDQEIVFITKPRRF